jgi:hypothetical protein
MSSSARRDELLYESDAALRLVDRAIQEMRVSGDNEDAPPEAVSVAAGDAPVDSQQLNAAD